MTSEKLPWKHIKKWNPKHWYPMPAHTDYEYLQREPRELLIDGWDIFFLDPRYLNENDAFFGDITSIGIVLTFSEAIKVCNSHNGLDLWKAP